MKRWLSQAALRAALVEHGWSAAFAALALVAFRAEAADFTLESFRGRAVSTATVEGIDIAARNAFFVSSVVLFLASFAVALLLLRPLQRITSAGAFALLEPLSIAGLALLLARAYTIPVAVSLELVLELQAAAIAIGVLDRWVFRRGAHAEPAAYFATLAIVAAGLGFVARDFAPSQPVVRGPWLLEHVGAATVLLHVLVRAATWRRDGARAAALCAAALSGAALLGWLPFLSVLRDELYLVLNNRGVLTVRPEQIELASLGVLALAMVVVIVRRRRAPPSLERSLLGATVPIFVFALVAQRFYRPVTMLPTDLFEPANAGLMIQQWFDFGRVPFVETFGAHGLSDSLWGYVYYALNGRADENWGYYSFMNDALGALLVYLVVRRFSANGYLALFVALFLPFRVDLFPDYCELALASLFVLDWLIARPSLWRWIAFAFYAAFALVWRLDLGFANAVACAGALVAMRWLRPEFRPRIRDIVISGALCALVCGGGFIAIARARGVDPLARLADLAYILNSHQAFGHSQIAPRLGPDVVWHLTVIPLAVLVVLAAVCWTQRGRVPGGSARAFAALLIAFGSVYYFANFQRGLVRHTWWELGNVYVLSFGFAVFGAGLFLFPWQRPRNAAIAFLALVSLLSGSFGLQGALPERAEAFKNHWESATARSAVNWRTTYKPEPIDRSPREASYDEHHYAAFASFVDRMLAPGQTFLDLSNSPMLYVLTHRRSPHYLNHLYLAYGERLQKSEIAEFGRSDVPLVVVWAEQDLSERDGVSANRSNFIDRLHNSVAHWLFYEWLHARYEPWCVVQRWQIWRRKNWMAPVPPNGQAMRVHATVIEPTPENGRVALTPAPANGDAAGAPMLELAPDRVAYLTLDGNATAPGLIDVELHFGAGAERPVLKRALMLRPGDGTRYWTLPGETEPRTLERVEFDLSRAAGFEIHSAAVSDLTAPAYSDVVARARRVMVQHVRQLAWLWANRDARNAIAGPVLRRLWPPPTLQVDPDAGPPFENGMHRERAAFALTENAPSRPVVGGRVLFARGGERVVERIDERVVEVSGERLDPVADGPPNEIRLADEASAEPSRIRRRFFYAPLELAQQRCYLAVRAAPGEPGTSKAVARFGRNGVDLGCFYFDLVGSGPQDYLFRISSQYTWASGDPNWVSVDGLDGAVEVWSVRLLAGD